MAKLVVKRRKEWNNRAQNFSLFIDGEKIDTIGNGEIKELEIEPGKHTIYAKMNWCFSPEFEIELNNEKSKAIEVSGFKLGRWIMPITLIIIAAYYIAEFFLKIPARPLLYALIPGFFVMVYYTSFERKKYLVIEDL